MPASVGELVSLLHTAFGQLAGVDLLNNSASSVYRDSLAHGGIQLDDQSRCLAGAIHTTARAACEDPVGGRALTMLCRNGASRRPRGELKGRTEPGGGAPRRSFRPISRLRPAGGEEATKRLLAIFDDVRGVCSPAGANMGQPVPTGADRGQRS
jgi:hypothetical protein